MSPLGRGGEKPPKYRDFCQILNLFGAVLPILTPFANSGQIWHAVVKHDVVFTPDFALIDWYTLLPLRGKKRKFGQNFELQGPHFTPIVYHVILEWTKPPSLITFF